MPASRLPIGDGCVLYTEVPNDPGVRRSLVLQVLFEASGQSGGGLRLARTSTGQPLVEGADDVNVSWAHRPGFLLVGAARSRLGVDIEIADRTFPCEDVVAVFFSPEDRRAFHGLMPAQRMQGFYLLWTLREAYLKALGRGLDALLEQELDFSWVLRGRAVPEEIEETFLAPGLGKARLLSRRRTASSSLILIARDLRHGAAPRLGPPRAISPRP